MAGNETFGNDTYTDKNTGIVYKNVPSLVDLVLKRRISSETKTRLKRYGRIALVGMLEYQDLCENNDGSDYREEDAATAAADMERQYEGLDLDPGDGANDDID